jgi:CHAD domain-containing protein
MNETQVNRSLLISDYAYQMIQQSFQRFVDQEKSVWQDKDPEPLHQMRVGMRRFRTGLQVFHQAIALPKAVNDSSIGKIARSLGETRDLDVLQQELIKRYQPLLQKTEQPQFEQVIKHLQQQRSQSFLKLQKTLKSDRYQNLKQAIQDWLAQPTYTTMGNLSVLDILPDMLLPLICQLFLHSGWLVGTTIQSGTVSLIPIEHSEDLNQQFRRFSADLHDLRKQIKGVRYQSEFFAAFYGTSYLERVEEFKHIQEILGKLQDHVVLCHFLETTLKSDFAKVFPSIEKAIQEDTHAFWQSWQPLQERYLSFEFRQSLRSLITTPLQRFALT